MERRKWPQKSSLSGKASLYRHLHRMKPGAPKEIEPSRQKSFQLIGWMSDSYRKTKSYESKTSLEIIIQNLILNCFYCWAEGNLMYLRSMTKIKLRFFSLFLYAKLLININHIKKFRKSINTKNLIKFFTPVNGVN